mgnify:CR=1 FL=1|tara:strand:+ start:502 stop:2388 length:1887 start_codon:yes stop_codon:yes gene_type:complete
MTNYSDSQPAAAAKKKARQKKRPAKKKAPAVSQLLAIRRRAKRQGWAQYIRSEADEQAALAGYYFDQARADHVVNFARHYLQLSGEYEGRPFEPIDWQVDGLMAPLYGWVIDSEEYGRTIRRFRRAYVQVPKKNGKSPIGYWVALYHLVADGRNIKGARVYSASTDKEQASIVHGDAINAVDASPKLRKILRTNATAKNIYCTRTNGFYRVLSSSPRRNEGWNASAIVADELHKWYGRQLWDALKWAFATRAEPMLFSISTAGDDEESICFEVYEYAKAILDGDVVDFQFFPLIYEPDDEDDPDSEATWYKTNPSLGHHLKLSTFKADYEEAKMSPGLFASWKQLRLNYWQTGGEPWIAHELWNAGKKKRAAAKKRIDCFEDFSEADLAGCDCWAGLDLSLTDDLSACALIFPNESALSIACNHPIPDETPAGWQDSDEHKQALAIADDKEVKFRVLVKYWLPEQTAARTKKQTRYWDWAEAGWLTLTEGSEVDFDHIRADIAQLAETYTLNQLIYDPMFGAYLTQRLELEEGIERQPFKQTLAQFTLPTAILERLIMQGRILHNGNPVLDWNLKNTKVKSTEAGMKPIKPVRGSIKKIDGIIATIQGLAGALRGERMPQFDDGPRFV